MRTLLGLVSYHPHGAKKGALQYFTRVTGNEVQALPVVSRDSLWQGKWILLPTTWQGGSGP